MTSKSRLGGLTVIFFLAFEEYTNVLSWRNRGLSAYHALSTSLPPAKKASLLPCTSVRVKSIQQTCTEHQLWVRRCAMTQSWWQTEQTGRPCSCEPGSHRQLSSTHSCSNPSSVHGRNSQYSLVSYSYRSVCLLNSRPCEYFWPMDRSRNTLRPSCAEAVKSWFSSQSTWVPECLCRADKPWLEITQ